MIAVQNDFSGGMDMVSSDVEIPENAYEWLVNGRNRFGRIDPILKHKKLTNAPVGKKQACIAVGNTLILFVAGFAYYQIDGDTDWVQIPNFIMSVTAEQYWTEFVPATSFTFTRKSVTNIQAPINVSADFKINGLPACVVVQDNENQPWVIFWDSVNQIFTSRITQDYNLWNNSDLNPDTSLLREYVPVGNMMMYQSGILFIVAPDKKSVYRSATYRPLDFMIVVDTDGNKLDSEEDGGATRLSFAFDFNEITCLKSINIPDAFIYGTAYNLRVLTLDYSNTIYGEPKFNTVSLIDVGIINQYSFMEVLGDYVFVSKENVRSFNAVEQFKFKGRNSIFSQQITKLLETSVNKYLKQQSPICIFFNDFALFNLDSKFGNVLAVFDSIIQKWVGFDITAITNIKQFAVVETLTESKLYCITEQDEVFHMFSENTTETAFLKTRSYQAFSTQEVETYRLNTRRTSVEHKGSYVRPMFNGGTVNGSCVLREIVDEQESITNREIKPLKINIGGIRFPVMPPVGPNTEQRVNVPTFSTQQGLTGKKISYIIAWNTDSQLVEYEVSTSEAAGNTTSKQKQEVLSNTYK